MLQKAEKYITEVTTGRAVVGKWVRLAVARHLSDLKKSRRKAYAYRFDPHEAARAIEFFELQRFAENELSDQPFVLLPWQAFLLAMAYGWRRKSDGHRRFVKVVIKVARGNGKTELLAGIGNLALLFEPERDPQIFWIATKKDQARIGWGRQKKMVERLRRDHPEIAAVVDTAAHSIYETSGMGSVKYLGRDSKTEDGFSPYYALADEMHAWQTNDLMNVMESGMVKRRRPMTWIITTEGYNRDGPWDELEEQCQAMLADIAPQDELLALLYDLDEGDDWHDPIMWKKANPSLGESVQVETFATRYRQALSQGLTTETDFKVKNLNIKVRSGHGWIRDEHWLACPDKIDMESLKGRICYGGVDLSSTFDFSSLCLLFPDEAGAHTLLWWNWLPEETFQKRARKFPAFYEWERKGWINVVPGNYIDYEYIRHVVTTACQDYQVQVIGCDPANAWQLIGNLQNDGVPIEKYAMSWSNISEPCKQVERLFAGSQINHGSNPVARWMFQNVHIRKDANANVRPDKGRSKESIDGVIAAIIALGQYLTNKTINAYSPDLDIIAL